MKLTELRREIDTATMIIENLTTPPLIIDRNTRGKINKETEAWDNTINQLNLINIYILDVLHNSNRIAVF